MPSRAVACCGTPVMSAPLNQMRPEVGIVSPEIRRKKVVLPAPLGPMIERSSPRWTLTSTSDTASKLPYARVRRSVRSRTASGIARDSTRAFAVSRRRAVLSCRADMTPHVVPQRWKSGMIEIGAKIFAYVQASGIDPTGDTGVANSGLIIGPSAAVAVDALMVPSMTKRLVTAIKKTTRKPVAQLINTHHHLDHTAYLPKERILFAGDIAFLYVTPLAFQGHVGNWIKAADRLLRFDADVIVPGHGPIGTKKDLKHMRDYLALVRREAKQRFDAGMPAEAAAADIKLGVYASWSDPERILPNVMRCHQEFRDELDRPMDLPRMLAGMERLRGG